ncbi:unnamed protein product [Meganyctiphanes norvegica]|uniref:Peptidase M14 domain-containing protein n=1 Tax=Meganyctiphanes norvegica TaxID=48144 RepID=A0AAV2R8A1_MEGNR
MSNYNSWGIHMRSGHCWHSSFPVKKKNKRSSKIPMNEKNLDLLNRIFKSGSEKEYIKSDILNERKFRKNVQDQNKIKSSPRQKTSKLDMHKKKEESVIIIEAGAHAREWISPAVGTYIAQQLADPANSDLLKYATWVVVPLLNPDGYDYSHTDDRFWRKNRRLNKGRPECPGVDLNRNFNIKWAITGSSSNQCSETYHGTKAFSEKETKAIRKLIKRIKNVELYLSLHSYGQVILHPLGYTSDEPPGVGELRSMADAFANHISNNGGRQYAVEQAGLNYQSGGGSDDYAFSRGVPYSYTVELPDKWKDGFETPPEKILGISQEIWTGLKCLLGDLVPDAKYLC